MFRITFIYLCFAVAIVSLSGLIGLNAIINPSARPVESHVLFLQDKANTKQLSDFPNAAGWVTESGLVSQAGDMLVFLKRYQTADERRTEFLGVWSLLALALALVGLVVVACETALRWASRHQDQRVAPGSTSGSASARVVRSA